VRISVIVPAFNEETLLPRCLAGVRSAGRVWEERGWDLEMIVCDNNSTDRTREVAKAAGALVVFESVNQIARARNTGAKGAAGEWLVFIDADALPERALFEAMALMMERGDLLGGGAGVELEGVGGVARVATQLWNLLSVGFRWVAGSCVFCRADVFREAGGFSEELYASEEIELSRRMKREARRRGLRWVILRGVRLVSSGRKLRDCTAGDFLALLWRAVWTRGGVLRSREGLAIWYGGRR
jgi:glycosyltransferase involved in cell wall biosynthesis